MNCIYSVFSKFSISFIIYLVKVIKSKQMFLCQKFFMNILFPLQYYIIPYYPINYHILFQMMKKYFLKGKEYLSKKLEELDIQTNTIDYVDEQIPQRLKKPLQGLKTNQIDLEDSHLYDSLFKNYPNHHISHFLQQKYHFLIQSKFQPPQYKPPPNANTYIPPYDTELQRKALIFREAVQQYDESYSKTDEPLLCISVIHFHHKRGTQIQYRYPKNKTVEKIQDLIVHHAMPDSSHNKGQDYNFFNFEAQIKGKRKMLFGVSYFKQIKLTQQMKKNNSELTRSYVQKAVAIISTIPVFGYLKLRLAVTTKVFFEKFDNFEIIQSAYKDLNKNLLDTWPNMQLNDLFIGSDLKVIINLFGVSQFYQIWKAVLYQKRIVVYAHSSSSASSFILSLISLFPGLNTFGVHSKPISKYMQSLREYALPLRLFSSQNFLSMSFHIQDFGLLAKFQKNEEGNFLLGTTNRLLKESNDYGVQMLINLQNCTVEKRKSRIPWEHPSKKEKAFVSELQEIVESEKTVGYGGSEDCIRNQFHSFLKGRLLQIMTSIQLFRKFVKDCEEYSKSAKNDEKPTVNKKSSYKLIEDEVDNQNEQRQISSKQQFPPMLPSQISHIVFPQLLMNRSFAYFLQFHNESLPEIVSEEKVPSLHIDNYEYKLRLNSQEFICYNWLEKKLIFGKGQLRNFDGKDIRFFDNGDKVKSIYVGVVENGKYSKHGFYVDENDHYEGQYYNGVKEGYGKMTNKFEKYIGNFHHNLFSGHGQLVVGKQIYVGEFKDGLRNGCGKNQGNLNYDGQWINDQPHGSGLLKEEDKEYIGQFAKGKIDQNLEVTIRYENGSMYKGMTKNKKPDGRGFLVDEEGLLTDGIFVDGKLQKKFQQESEQKVDISEKQDEKEERNEEES